MTWHILNHRNAFTDINTPTRIFEYLALGKPVIAPHTPGIQDYFGQDSLLFFESGDAEGFAKKLEEIYSQPSLAMKTAARRARISTSNIAGVKSGRSWLIL